MSIRSLYIPLLVAALLAGGCRHGKDGPADPDPALVPAAVAPVPASAALSVPVPEKRSESYQVPEPAPGLAVSPAPEPEPDAEPDVVSSDLPEFSSLTAVPLDTFPVRKASEPGAIELDEPDDVDGGREKKLYRLQRGDKIEISIMGEDTMSRIVAILPDGTFQYLLIGSVKAEGLTVDQVQAEITKRLGKYYKEPVVSVLPVSLVEARETISIIGMVAYPGKINLATGDRIIDAVAKAGWLRTDTDKIIIAELSRSVLLRKNGRPVAVNFNRLFNDNDMTQNAKLRGGDILSFPGRRTKTMEVMAMGSVAEIGTFRIATGARVLDLLVAAKGLRHRPDGTSIGDLKEAFIRRGDKKRIPVNIKALLEGDHTQNIALMAGDMLYVPMEGTGGWVAIIGAVKNPGLKPIKKGDRLTHIMAKAGGELFSPDHAVGSLANLNASYVIRDGEPLDVNFKKLMTDKDWSQNIKVKDGDFIYIQEVGQERIFVIGEVNTPQVIPFNRDMTVIEAIARSGGVTERGRRKGTVNVIRGSLRDPVVLTADLKKIYRGDRDQRIALKDGDIVFVAEMPISKGGRYLGFITPFLSILEQLYDVRRDLEFWDDFRSE